MVPVRPHLTCGEAQCTRSAACQVGDAVANTTVATACMINEDNPNCPSLQCSQRVAGWNGAVCEKYGQDRPGFCDDNSICGTDFSLCSVVTARDPLYECADAACNKSCPVAATADLLNLSDVCHIYAATSACPDIPCSEYVAGWSANVRV